MHCGEVFTPGQIDAYLSRIGLQQRPELSFSGLTQLLSAQITHIPFDSIDVWATGCVPSLEPQTLFDKMIVGKRGGYCFELNTLFRVLLRSLGFDAYQVVCSLLNEDGSMHPPAHNVIICKLNGKKYYMDAGFGGPVPAVPLALTEGVYGDFRLTANDGSFTLARLEDGYCRPMLFFRDIPVSITELEPLNFYISQLPSSHFRHIIHVNQRNADGSIYCLNGNEFKIHRKGEASIQTIENITQLKTILLEYYHMNPERIPLREDI